MEPWLLQFSPITQALIASLFTWGVTAAGAAVVFFVDKGSNRLLHISLGFAAGVMVAASFWSLLAPSIALAEETGAIPWLPAAIGFLLGGVFIRLADAMLPHLHLFTPLRDAEGPHTSWDRRILLVLAITLHNIPEGLAVGVAFGAAAAGIEHASLGGAIALALGIGLQNAPEGRRSPCHCGRTASAAPARGGTASSPLLSNQSPQSSAPRA